MANKNWYLKSINFYDDEGNCVQYTEEEYKRDLTRYIKENDWFYNRKDEKEYFLQ